MPKKIVYRVRLRRKDTAEEQDRLILAGDEVTAGERAIERARTGLNMPMLDRKYAQFEILSCVAATPTS